VVVKNSAKVRLWLPVAVLSIGIGWGVALGCANSASQLPSSQSQPPAESGAVSTPELLARVGQAYERGLGQLSVAESDQLMDDLGDLGRRAGAGDLDAFRGLAALPLDGAYGEIAIMAVNSNDDLKECPVPTTEEEADLVFDILFLMETTEAIEKEYEKIKLAMGASVVAEKILEVGITRGLRYGGYRSWLKAKLARSLLTPKITFAIMSKMKCHSAPHHRLRLGQRRPDHQPDRERRDHQLRLRPGRAADQRSPHRLQRGLHLRRQRKPLEQDRNWRGGKLYLRPGGQNDDGGRQDRHQSKFSC